MQKVLSTIIYLFLMSILFTNVIHSESITIGHAIEQESEFSVKAKNITKFSGTSAVEICEVMIKNNTRDGYKVSIDTAFGALHSATSSNGETNIPYLLSKTQSGTSPSTSGGFTPLNVPNTPPTTETIILGVTRELSSDELLNTPTDIEFTLKVAISNANFLNMAGTYTDTLTITYTDL